MKLRPNSYRPGHIVPENVYFSTVSPNSSMLGLSFCTRNCIWVYYLFTCGIDVMKIFLKVSPKGPGCTTSACMFKQAQPISSTSKHYWCHPFDLSLNLGCSIIFTMSIFYLVQYRFLWTVISHYKSHCILMSIILHCGSLDWSYPLSTRYHTYTHTIDTVCILK